MQTLEKNKLCHSVSAQSQSVQLEFEGNRMTFLPDQGASITHLTFAPGAEILKPQIGYHFESSLLFPFPNRLEGGTYSFNGKEYNFPENDFGRPNALHGLVHDKPFSITDQGQDNTKVWVTASLTDNGTDSAYPFPFELQVTYSLSTASLRVEFRVTNHGDTDMPFGLGWHPYFNLDGHIRDCELKLPAGYEIEVDDNMIPTGKKSPSTCFDNYRSLAGIELDTCFEISEVNRENSTFVKLPDQQTLEIWQDEHHAFIQVFTPEDGQTIAIEPMTCGIDALNTGEGLQVLAPGTSARMCCGVRLK